MGPDPIKMGPDPIKNGPWAHMGPKWAKRLSRKNGPWAHMGPKWAHMGPKWALKCDYRHPPEYLKKHFRIYSMRVAVINSNQGFRKYYGNIIGLKIKIPLLRGKYIFEQSIMVP